VIFNPSILILIATILTVVGVAVGTFTMLAEYHQNKADDKTTEQHAILLRELSEALLYTQPNVHAAKTLSISIIHIDEFDASQIQRAS
jgi:hypothetical protein